ncbi:hypothetical protein HDU88_007798 [Geranomyces variabilis]|nr:hypothetical protein HDU88_007798 [Geranomyces variabilis]
MTGPNTEPADIAAKARFGSTDTLADGAGIWDSILKSVASSKAVPTKNVLVIGAEQAGKTTLINAIRKQRDAEQTAGARGFTEPELALTYSYMDISDEENEVLARAGFYHLASDTAFGNLIRFALDADALNHSMVLIVLDWTKPWEFITTLETWLGVLEREIAKRTKGSQGLFEELQEKLEVSWRRYTSPSEAKNVAAPSTNATPTRSFQHTITLPLGPGTLTRNIGLPIVIVAAKADATAALVRDLGYKEEQFDFIQQTLRTICLKYGAGLVYTSTHLPETFDTLRSYIFDLLLSPPPDTSTANATFKSPYGPPMKPQVVERDNVFVPAGWDSWGKINILRTGFDCAAIAHDSDLNGNNAHEASPPTAIYQSVIAVPPVQKLYTSEPAVVAENEQTFLERHLELLQNTTGSPGPSSSSDPSRGVKTPTSPSPAPSDEPRASKTSKSKDSASTSNREKIKSPNSADFPLPASLISSNAVSRAAGAIGASAGAAVGGSGAGGVSASQNEVLANFFQSLLQKKVPPPGPGAPVGTSSSTSSRSVSVSGPPIADLKKPGASADNGDEKTS